MCRPAPPAALRQVLPGPGAAGAVSRRDRDRPVGRARARRGDGRPRRGAAERARRARDRHRPAAGRGAARPSLRRRGAGDDRRAPVRRRSSSSRTMTRRARRSRRDLDARGYRVTPAGRDGARRSCAGRRVGRTSSSSTSGCPTSTGSRSSRRIRREATTPIVILSGRYEEREKVAALERGADDYVTKPFGVERAPCAPSGGAPPGRRPGRDAARTDRRRAARVLDVAATRSGSADGRST